MNRCYSRGRALLRTTDPVFRSMNDEVAGSPVLRLDWIVATTFRGARRPAESTPPSSLSRLGQGDLAAVPCRNRSLLELDIGRFGTAFTPKSRLRRPAPGLDRDRPALELRARGAPSRSRPLSGLAVATRASACFGGRRTPFSARPPRTRKFPRSPSARRRDSPFLPRFVAVVASTTLIRRRFAATVPSVLSSSHGRVDDQSSVVAS